MTNAPVQARVDHGGGDYLDRDARPLGHHGQVCQLVTHDLMAANPAVQYLLVQQHPQQRGRRILPVQDRLPRHPGNDPLLDHVGGSVGMRFQDHPRIRLSLQVLGRPNASSHRSASSRDGVRLPSSIMLISDAL